MNREAIYGAFAALLNAKLKPTHVAVISRKFLTFTQVPAADFPALIINAESETASTEPNLPTSWRIALDLFLYVSVKDDPSKSASEKMNPILDAIEEAIQTSDSPMMNRNTLGGLVRYVRIDGAIKIDETLTGDTAIAVVPIEILTA